ncbi:MAG: class I SAM-dependent methyltransferase [Actinobacteria bacterium]|nr:class I SAM-dependent methyltransferase [Actinomycetota bacterium]
MPDREEMRAFWNEKAEENPLWYVASNLEYSSPDEKRFWESGEEEVAAALAEAGVSGGDVAVDIGCGVGRLSRALASRFERVESRDVSTRMAELAAKNLAPLGNVNVRVIEGDGRVDLPDASAEFVLSLQVFQHIPSARITLSYIREAGRILKPGGVFVFQLRSFRAAGPLLGSVEHVARVVVETARRARKKPPESLDSPAWHGSRVGKWQIRAAVQSAGMTVRSMRWISLRGASLQVVCSKP